VLSDIERKKARKEKRHETLLTQLTDEQQFKTFSRIMLFSLELT